MTVPLLKSLARRRGIDPLPTQRKPLLEALLASPPVEDEEAYRARLLAVVEKSASWIRDWTRRTEEIRAELGKARLAHDMPMLLSRNKVIRVYQVGFGSMLEKSEAFEQIHAHIEGVRRKAFDVALQALPRRCRYRSKELYLFPDEKRYAYRVGSQDFEAKISREMLCHTIQGSTRRVVEAAVAEYKIQCANWEELTALYQARITSYVNHVIDLLPFIREPHKSQPPCRKDAIPVSLVREVLGKAKEVIHATPGTRVDVPMPILLYAKRCALIREAYRREFDNDLSHMRVLKAAAREYSGAYRYLVNGPLLQWLSPNVDPFSSLPPHVLRDICNRLLQSSNIRNDEVWSMIGGVFSIAWVLSFLRPKKQGSSARR